MVSEEALFSCKSIELEKSREEAVNKWNIFGAKRIKDNPIEELPGRHVMFTNQRIIIVDSSYLRTLPKDDFNKPLVPAWKILCCDCTKLKGK